MPDDCVFCKINSGDIPSEILYRDDHCFVVRDIAPKAPVHLLVIPNDHFTYVKNLTPERFSMVGDMVSVAAELAQREGVGDGGSRLIINQGDDAGQEVEHLHLHVLGGRRLGAMV